ncbi:MAG: lysophospholipid acyltransferase family protein [Candidatus Bipolaricaulota bacterium]|nr:lysophospholipid acyltransferase family protein [Candidatus Bipolaricaulota bacterium]
MLYTVLVLFFTPVWMLFRLRVYGRERIVPDGRYIAVARHRSYWDILLLVLAFGWRNHIHFIARKGLLKNPVFMPFVRLFSTTIGRENFTRDDFRRTLKSFRNERIIGIFPEGTTRSRIDAKAGAIRFARLTEKELLPVRIEARGPYPPRYPFHFPQVTVSIGKAFSVSDLETEVGPAEGRAKRNLLLNERLMERIDAVESEKGGD